MKNIICILLLVLMAGCGSSKKSTAAQAAAALQNYYTLQVYHSATADQLNLIEAFLKSAYLPAMRRNGIATVGVFKPIGNDTAADKKVIVFTPYTSLQQYEKITGELRRDITLEQAAPAYVNAPHNSPAFTRYETILVQAFKDMPTAEAPKLSGPKSERVYELRSYEGPTEKLYQSKVKMFNEGGEIALFKRLNFNAVFYGSVIAGARMPNLMYMTSFENKADRDAHWKSFGDDAEWKILSKIPEYQNTVSHMDITFLTATDYSDF